jgi:hypothetical protein
VPLCCTGNGRMWPEVAQDLTLLAPRLAPQKFVVRHLMFECSRPENDAAGSAAQPPRSNGWCSSRPLVIISLIDRFPGSHFLCQRVGSVRRPPAVTKDVGMGK